MATKSSMISLRLSGQMDEWLEEQCRLLGMTKSEVVRFWLQTSMLTFEKSVNIADKVASKQLEGRMSISDVIGGRTHGNGCS